MSIKRVLIIRCGALGDLVYATSVIDALKLEFGEDTKIDFVCTPGSGTLFNADKRVNAVFLLKHKKIPIIFSSQKKQIINSSKKRPYDLLINFEMGKQFKGLVRSIVAEKKVGAFFDDTNIPENITHMVDITKYLFKDIVSKTVYEKSFPRLIGNEIKLLKEKYKLPEKYIIISPSNSHQQKNRINYRAWENESWKELISSLQKNIPVVIIGNKGEESFFNKLLPYPDGVINLVGKTPLIDLIGVIESASALVATDTGTAHIASATNTEVFALIGPTPANVTGPYQTPYNKVHNINMNLDCSPCYKTEVMKACTDNLCMKNIKPDFVLEYIKKTDLFKKIK
jgi:ADP-heptose:LPS heptosyltransferase